MKSVLKNISSKIVQINNPNNNTSKRSCECPQLIQEEENNENGSFANFDQEYIADIEEIDFVKDEEEEHQCRADNKRKFNTMKYYGINHKNIQMIKCINEFQFNLGNNNEGYQNSGDYQTLFQIYQKAKEFVYKFQTEFINKRKDFIEKKNKFIACLELNKKQQSQYIRKKDKSIQINKNKKDIFQNNQLKNQKKIMLNEMIDETDNDNQRNEINESSSKSNQNQNTFSSSSETLQAGKKKKSKITIKILQKLKVLFQDYNNRIQSPDFIGKMKFTQIADQINFTAWQVKLLFDEYIIDPLFAKRMKKLRKQQQTLKSNGKTQNKVHKNVYTKTKIRADYLKKIIEEKGMMTHVQLAKELSAFDHLLYIDQNGRKVPFTRKVIENLLRINNIEPITTKIINNINDPQLIEIRQQYAKRYLQITLDSNSQVCFLGQYSFALNTTLQKCPYYRKKLFCINQKNKAQQFKSYSLKSSQTPNIETASKNGSWCKQFQYLIAISRSGLLYHQFFNNMYKQINLASTLIKIGKAMMSRGNYLNRYLFLQSTPFHNRSSILTLQKEYPAIKVIFIPYNYCANLNPTQLLCNQLKQYVGEQSEIQNKSQDILLQEILESMKEKNMKRYFDSINPFIEKAYNRQKF